MPLLGESVTHLSTMDTLLRLLSSSCKLYYRAHYLDLEPEELAKSPCPAAECQARYDLVQESCQVGDNLYFPFDQESDSALIYGETFFPWYEQEQCIAGGFIPEACCAKAVSDLDMSMGVSDGPCYYDDNRLMKITKAQR